MLLFFTAICFDFFLVTVLFFGSFCSFFFSGFYLRFLVVFVVVVAVAAAAVVLVTAHLFIYLLLTRRNCSPAVRLYVVVFSNCMSSSPISSKSLLTSTQ